MNTLSKLGNPSAKRSIALVCTLILATLIFPSVFPEVGAQPSLIIKVDWSPHVVTPYENMTVQANVTSSIGINSVSIYYRTGKPGLKFNSTSEYEKKRMLPLYDGIWVYNFDKQPNATAIYFFISVVDSNGAETTWPGNYPDYRSPREVRVQYPSKPYVNAIYIYLNELFLSDLSQQANVTVSFSGYLPSVPDPYYRNLDIRSNGPYRNYFGLTIFEDPSTRFWYQGKSSGLIDLAGSAKQVPYDQYALDFTLTIPYRFENLTYIASTPVEIFSPQSVWNAWSIPKPVRAWYSVGNDTRVTIRTVLSRRVPDFYPPLVLMLVAFAVLGLVPLISKYQSDKRFDLFLNAIILASSAELSQTIYPVGGFLGNNIFLESFALIMASAVLMMAVSSLPLNVREKSFYEFHFEFFTTVLIVAAASLIIVFDTNFPWVAKLLTPLAGCAGSILMALYIYFPRMVSELRTRFRTRYSVSKSNRYSIGTFMSFAIAIGYASGFLPEQNLWLLTVGLTACAIAYLIMALRSHDKKMWSDYGLPTLTLAIAAIGPLTPKPLNASWALVFVILGCIGMALDIKTKR